MQDKSSVVYDDTKTKVGLIEPNPEAIWEEEHEFNGGNDADNDEKQMAQYCRMHDRQKSRHSKQRRSFWTTKRRGRACFNEVRDSKLKDKTKVVIPHQTRREFEDLDMAAVDIESLGMTYLLSGRSLSLLRAHARRLRHALPIEAFQIDEDNDVFVYEANDAVDNVVIAA